MPIQLEINGSAAPDARFLSFAPSPARLRQTGGTAPLAVTVSSRAANATGGRAVFYAQHTAASAAQLDLTLPQNGAWVDFFAGGRWQSPSVSRDDCLIEVKAGTVITAFPCMVRVRKNANALKPVERDRFLAALAVINASGVYQAFRNVHVGLPAADAQAHGGPHFLPWHRAYLLDLERELQAVDAQVTLPYWRFDQPARNVFQGNFMGATRQVTLNSVPPAVTLVAGNPLTAWVTDNTPGIRRGATFNTLTRAAPGIPSQNFPLINEAQTLALGNDYDSFDVMEGTPHAAAHVSFIGSISSISTAVKDPLFFLLHCNVDRLWALWQWIEKRTAVSDPLAYDEQPTADPGGKLADTMWPWNGVNTPPRPPFPPPRPAMRATTTTLAPGVRPTVRSMIDKNGKAATADRLGFGYDTVPFE